MSKDLFDDVAVFHEGILGDFASPLPTMVSPEYVHERLKFMVEELDEFINAEEAGDIVEMADAIADLVYVALGTAYRMGLPFPEIWDAVHAANMRKVRGETKRGNKVDAMKPVGWVGPETEIARAIGRRVP